MPTNLTDSIAFTSPVAVPNDGEARNAAGIRSPYQALANRAAYLEDLTEGGGAGVKRIRTVANLTALAALSANAGDFVLAGKTGLYVYIATGAPIGVSPLIVTSTATSGAWWKIVATGYDMIGAPFGVAGLDAGSLVPLAQLPDARRVHYYNSIANLAADATHNDGDVAICSTRGVYQFFASTSSGLPQPLAITATAGTAGEWFLTGVGQGALNIANGVAGLDASSKVPVASVPNATIGTYQATLSSGTQVVNTTPYAIPAPTLTLSLVVGDVVLIDGVLFAYTGGDLGTGGGIELGAQGGLAAVRSAVVAPGHTGACPIVFPRGRFVATATGSVTFGFTSRALPTVGGSPNYFTALADTNRVCSITAMVIRT